MRQLLKPEIYKSLLSADPAELEPWKKNVLAWEILERLVSTCEGSLVGRRDNALILFAFASGCCKHSILASVKIEDLIRTRGGYIYKPRTCTDHEGTGTYFLIMGRAASALNTWLKASGLTKGKLFRGITRTGKITEGICNKTVARVLKKRASLIGQNSSVFKWFSSLAGEMMCRNTEQLMPCEQGASLARH